MHNSLYVHVSMHAHCFMRGLKGCASCVAGCCSTLWMQRQRKGETGREREREVNDSLGVSVIADALPVKSCSQALQKAALAL